MRTKQILFGTLFLALSCTKDSEKGPQEAVQTNDKTNAAAVNVESPENAGETAAKKAGIEAAQEIAPIAVAETAKTQSVAPPSSNEMVMSIEALNVRKGPSMKYNVLRVLKKGEKVAALSKENGIWVKIGNDEFVSEKFLLPVQSH